MAEAGVWYLPFRGPWLVLRYRPTTLWSLKSSQATSSGGKSLLVPTPYSIKLGLVDAAIQTGRVEDGERLFDVLKGRPVRVRPPRSAIVSAAFLKMWKIDVCPDKGKNESEEEYDITVRQRFLDYSPLADLKALLSAPIAVLKQHLRDTFAPTVGFREYIQFGGTGEDALFHIAVAAEGIKIEERAVLARAALACSYSGKRGCFVRFAPADTADGLLDVAELPEAAAYTLPCSVWRSSGGSVSLGTIQPLDELSTTAKWNNVSTYGPGQVHATREGITTTVRGKQVEADRVFVESFVPYRLTGSVRGYSYYQRADAS